MSNGTLKLCRLCMYEEKCDDSNTVLNIFDNNLENFDGIHEKIRKCIQINLNREDVIPPHVCKNCINAIEQFYNFFEKCQLTDQTLKVIFNINFDCMTPTSKNVDTQLSVNHLSHEGITYVPVKDYDLIYKNRTYITNIRYFSESYSTFPNKINNCDVNNDASTSKAKDNVLDNIINLSDSDSSSSLNPTQDSKSPSPGTANAERTNRLDDTDSTTILYYPDRNKPNVHQVDESVLPKTKRFASDVKDKPSCHLQNVKKTTAQPQRPACKNKNTTRQSIKTTFKVPHTSNKSYICSICEEQNVFQNRMKGDTPHHKATKHYHCRNCNFITKSISILRTHTSTKHRLRQCICKVCARYFKSELNLRQHAKQVNLRQKCICNIYGKPFKKKFNVTTCTVKRQSRQMYNCTICSKRFLKVEQLREHMVSHKSNSLKCPHCHKGYSSYSNYLRKHMLKCDPGLKEAIAMELKSSVSLPNSSVR